MVDVSKLDAFRNDARRSFRQEATVLGELLDAMAPSPYNQVITLVDAPLFGHHWPSLYKALERGRIDQEQVRPLLWKHMPPAYHDGPLVVSIDITPIARPESQTLEDRTLVHVSNAPHGSIPVQPGWDMLGAMLVPVVPSAAVYPLELRRIPSIQTHRQAAATLMKEVTQQTERRVQFLLDREFCNAPFFATITDIEADLLTRMRTNGKVYREPPPKTGKSGRPRLDGPVIHASHPETQTTPDARWESEDRLVEVIAWHQVHFRKARHVSFTLFRVTRRSARDTQRDPRVSWFV